MEECAPVIELFKPVATSVGDMLVDEALVRMYRQSAALASIRSREGRASGESRRDERT